MSAPEPFLPDHRHPCPCLPEGADDLPEPERARLVAERVRLLHVHGPASWHGTVLVVGNRNGLLVLRDAVDEALASPALRGSTTAMASDGEGYGVEVTLVDEAWTHPAWETAPLPYHDPVARGGRDPDWDVARLRQALRNANAGLFKRGARPVPDPTLDPVDERG